MVKLCLALAFSVLVPSMASAALFPKSSKVTMLDAKSWKSAMKEPRASVVAFVAPWCGHCQRLAPDYLKVAAGMDPLVPFYAVDCDAADNKQLCASQGVKGFPTVKMFPKGSKAAPMEFTRERDAKNLFYWVSRSIPAKIDKPKKAEGLSKWKFDNRGKRRAILLNKGSKVPLLWKVLANRYGDDIVFAIIHDKKGRVSKALGFDIGAPKDSKVIVFAAEEGDGILYNGVLKYSPLTKFLESLVDGSIDKTQHTVGDEQVVLAAQKETSEDDESPGNKAIGEEGEIAEDDGEVREKDEL